VTLCKLNSLLTEGGWVVKLRLNVSWSSYPTPEQQTNFENSLLTDIGADVNEPSTW